MPDIKTYIRDSRNQEVDKILEDTIKNLESEGYTVEFGKIGIRTSYALLYTENHEEEIVGYTFLKDVNFYKENIGKLKALQQAIARKNITKEAKAK